MLVRKLKTIKGEMMKKTLYVQEAIAQGRPLIVGYVERVGYDWPYPVYHSGDVWFFNGTITHVSEIKIDEESEKLEMRWRQLTPETKQFIHWVAKHRRESANKCLAESWECSEHYIRFAKTEYVRSVWEVFKRKWTCYEDIWNRVGTI